MKLLKILLVAAMANGKRMARQADEGPPGIVLRFFLEFNSLIKVIYESHDKLLQMELMIMNMMTTMKMMVCMTTVTMTIMTDMKMDTDTDTRTIIWMDTITNTNMGMKTTTTDTTITQPVPLQLLLFWLPRPLWTFDYRNSIKKNVTRQRYISWQCQLDIFSTIESNLKSQPLLEPVRINANPYF